MIPLHHFAAFALTCFFAAGCGGSSDPRELVEAGNSKLGSGKHAAALASFESAQQALAGNTADPLYHAAKIGAIDARVHIDAPAATSEFLDYAKSAPSAVRDSDFIEVSGRLAGVDAISEALDVVVQGKAAFAGSTKMVAQEQLIVRRAKERAAAGDDATRKKLQGIGYL